MAFNITSWGSKDSPKDTIEQIIENFRALKEDAIVVVNWESVVGKPIIGDVVPHTHVKADITDFEHTHNSSDIVDLTETIQDIIGLALTDSASIDVTYDDINNQIKAEVRVDNTTLTIDSTNNCIKVVDNLYADKTHTHLISDITMLQFALDQKANLNHTHIKAQITDFEHNHSFKDLSDTPDIYVADKVVVVNPTGDGITYADFPNGTFIALTDTPSVYEGSTGKYLAVKSDGSGIEFVNPLTISFDGVFGNYRIFYDSVNDSLKIVYDDTLLSSINNMNTMSVTGELLEGSL